MLLDLNESCLVLVDVQTKLTPLVHAADKLIQNCAWLLTAAKMLDIPVLVGEQYPKGLGHTIPELIEALPENTPIIEKMTFSCAAEEAFSQELKTLDRPQVILMGIEAHVCVLQTALELQVEGCEVYVVADAVSSRNPDDVRYALDRMNGEGIIVVTKEMVVFEWLRQAGTEKFKKINRALFQE